MKRISRIKDVIARDTWISRGKDGKGISHEIIVGRPFQIPSDKNHDWVCPVSIGKFTSRIVPAYGVGPVDALMNAMALLKTFSDKINKEEKPTPSRTLRRVPRRK